MDNFYDLNDFCAFMIRKWKSFLSIIILMALLFSGVRFVGLMKEYKNQPKDTGSQTEVKSDEPIWSKVLVNIEIAPKYEKHDGQLTEVTQRIIDGYRTFGTSETVMNKMYDKWYAEESKEDARRKTKLQQYGYILDKEAKYPYAKVDFYGQFILDGTDLNSVTRTSREVTSTESVITLGFKSTNEEIARKVADNYAKEITAMVKKEITDFEYKVLGTTVIYELPTASAGTQTTRVISGAVTTAQITLRSVFAQTIKGLVWGAMLGVFFAIIVLFFAYMMTKKIYTVHDLKKYGITILGLGFTKRRIFGKLKGKIYCNLEGYKWDKTGFEKIAKNVSGNFENRYENEKIFVTGTGSALVVKKVVEELNNHSKTIQYVQCNRNTDIKEKKLKVLLVENFGKSMKYEVEREIEVWTEKNAVLCGMIGLE